MTSITPALKVVFHIFVKAGPKRTSRLPIIKLGPNAPPDYLLLTLKVYFHIFIKAGPEHRVGGDLKRVEPAYYYMRLPAKRGRGTHHGCGGTKVTRHIPTANEGESFNIVNVSGSDDSDAPCPTPITPASDSPMVCTETTDGPPDFNNTTPAQALGSLIAVLPGTSNDPLLDTSKSLKGHSMQYFFTRGPDNAAKCNFCSREPFLPKTSNASLRNHLRIMHLAKYIDQAIEQKWAVLYVQPVCSAIKNGYTIEEIKAHYITRDNLEKLPSCIVDPNPSDTDGRASVPPFSIDEF
ncbi:hypothetical protein SCLCIDRAFT_8042 [Scleroderma citrinum Foug A]|uniref:BED-type domain-containing protein n=1 Tax=Scleroderma citrinum Foug A TaxID=1036808 RepID=A0A0C3ECQ0_9AGAM|nr:hypothetical protein SCLCIDRAFT_8042 [Scleroderma citrinum Foug A]